MRYVFNSAVIGRPGHYEYRLLTDLEADAWLRRGQFISRVGNRHAAQYIEARFGVRCTHSREPMTMMPGDEGLVVRLMYQPQTTAEKYFARETEEWEIGLLKRTA